MKALRFGSLGALLLGIIMLSFATFSEKSRESEDGNVVIGATIKDLYDIPQIIASDVSADDAPIMMITGTTDIPLYPDARQVETWGKGGSYDKPGGGDYTFWSDSSLDEVVSFYKRELVRRGWTVDVEERSSPPTAPIASIDFGWINPVKEVPIRRYLALSVSGWPTSSKVSLRFELWPDAENVPLYPGAQQVQVAWVNNKYPEYPDVDNYQRVTTYETKATVSEIEAYYKDAMVQHGWAMGRSEPPTHYFFSYRHDVSCPPGSGHVTWCGTGSLIDIFIYPQENGTTNVELRVAIF